MTPSCNNNGNSMTSAERSSPLDTAEANNSSDGGLEATGIVTDTEQQDGNNNEANDSNNNVGTTVTSETPTTASISASSATPGSSAEASLSVIRPPALPPRPPNLMLPHAGAVATRGLQMPYTIMQPSGLHGNNGYSDSRMSDTVNTSRNSSIWKSLRKKYVLLCCLCGGLCLALGILYLVIYFVLGRYTSSLHYFQSLPLYIPSIVLCVTGLLVLCFVRRGNRIGYLIKLCGICCLASAVLCVVVTVTTTVIHMNRLQTLRECVYQGSIQTCTCFAGFFDPTMTHHDATMRFVFAETPNCEVVHGVLYSCLRALFGLSVIGILVCIFSCMLVYQLLSHERKKKYWEQLELRCRHLYRRQHQQQQPHLGHHQAAASSILLTPGSQCGYCTTTTTEDHRYYNVHPELYPGGLWASNRTTSTEAPADTGCYWNPQRSNGNIYSPNPEAAAGEMHANDHDNDTEENSRLTRSVSRSFRNWFPWLSSRIASLNTGSSSEVVMRPNSMHRTRPNPLWRHSNPDSHYGFRQHPSSNSSYRGRYHLPSSGTTPADLSHYSAIPSDHLPRYLWGPPPPYSQPPSIENIREAAEAAAVASAGGSNSANSTTIVTSNADSMTSNSQGLTGHGARTTRSGLLQQDYDDTVKSAMHLYERNVINSNSLPSRRLSRKNNLKSNLKNYMTQSVANLQRTLKEEEEAALFSEVRQKLNALNGMYRYQHSKAAQELAEIRRALNSLQTSGPAPKSMASLQYKHQNLPLPPIPSKKHSTASTAADHLIYQPPSVVSSSNSTTENKYETIGKSLEPYKIEAASSSGGCSSGDEKKKPKRLPSYSSSASSSSAQGGDYGFSSASPMSVATATGLSGGPTGSHSPSSSGDENKVMSSHYAQISPLRGQALLPRPPSTEHRHSNIASPVKSYFQELQRQDAAKSLPNINAVLPNLTSVSGQYRGHQRPQRSQTNIQSPLLLQPQTLHHLTTSTSGESPLKPRSYSASSEMLLSNAQYKFNQNTRALVGSPIHHNYPRGAGHQRPPSLTAYNQRPRAASSSSMLASDGMPIHNPIRMYPHQYPYQQLPGASLSLQTLNINNKLTTSTQASTNGSCVYLRPEQNIPEVFANPGTVFKPIDEVCDNASDVNDNDGNVLNDTGAISRDDIVVTMRSVNV